MVTAMDLSDAGHEVELFEARNFVGGKVGSWVDKDGNHIEMGLHVFFGCYYNLFGILERVGTFDRSLRLKEHTHIFVNKGGTTGALDFRMGGIGAPFNGLKAFATTEQLGLYDKIMNAVRLGTSPIVRALVDFDGGMQMVRDLDDISFSEWFLSFGGSRGSIQRMWDPIAYALGFIDCDNISARCMLTIFQLFAIRSEASVRRRTRAAPRRAARAHPRCVLRGIAAHMRVASRLVAVVAGLGLLQSSRTHARTQTQAHRRTSDAARVHRARDGRRRPQSSAPAFLGNRESQCARGVCCVSWPRHEHGLPGRCCACARARRSASCTTPSSSTSPTAASPSTSTPRRPPVHGMSRTRLYTRIRVVYCPCMTSRLYVHDITPAGARHGVQSCVQSACHVAHRAWAAVHAPAPPRPAPTRRGPR